MADATKLTIVERRMALLLRRPAIFPLTSWYDFAELREVVEEFSDLTHDQIRDVIDFGVREWFLKPRWVGVGMTPWAGSARRTRIYELKDKEIIRLFLQRVDVLEKAEKESLPPINPKENRHQEIGAIE